MRPDDVGVAQDQTADGYDVPIAADLRLLDRELEASGLRARSMLQGRTQPTNYFAMDLRARLLGVYSGEQAAESAIVDVTAARGRPDAPSPRLGPGRDLTRLAPERRRLVPAPSMLLNIRWALLAAALATGVLVAAAFGTGAIPR